MSEDLTADSLKGAFLRELLDAGVDRLKRKRYTAVLDDVIATVGAPLSEWDRNDFENFLRRRAATLRREDSSLYTHAISMLSEIIEKVQAYQDTLLAKPAEPSTRPDRDRNDSQTDFVPGTLERLENDWARKTSQTDFIPETLRRIESKKFERPDTSHKEVDSTSRNRSSC